ncbi:MAG: transcriptional regulator [Spirochaetaceae bacterium]|nr:MAG: transcriptional regulator [Spirochaetaceae bacterium]
MDRIADIARVIAEMQDPMAVEHILRELLTGGEAEKLSLRWDIVRLLSGGKSQRTIAHELGVSLCKITRGARELKKKGSVLKKVFESKSSPSYTSQKEE